MRRKWHGIWPAKPRRSEEREETCRPPRNPSSPHRHCEPQLASPSLRTPTRLTVIANPNSPHRHCEPQLASPSLRTPIGVKQPRHTLPIEKSAHTRTQESWRAVLAPHRHREPPRAPSSSRAASRPIVIASRLAPHRHREPPLRRRGDPGLSTRSPLPPSPTCPQRPWSIRPRYTI
jgi:hypothetical protein